MAAPASSPPPAAVPSGGAAPQPPAAASPPAAPPPLATWRAGKLQIGDDPARIHAIQQIAQQVFNGKIDPGKLHFSIGPAGLQFSFIDPRNQYHNTDLKPPDPAHLQSSNPQIKADAEDAALLFNTAAFVTGVIQNPPAAAPAAAPASTAAAAPAAAPAAAVPAAPVPAPGSAAAPNPLQQQIADLTNTVNRLMAQPAAGAAPPPFYPYPMAYPPAPMAAGAPPAAGAPHLLPQAPQDPRYQALLANTLRAYLPRIQSVINQLQGPANDLERAQLAMALAHINHNPFASADNLLTAERTIQQTVYNLLQRQTTAVDRITALQVTLAANNSPESNLITQTFLAAPPIAFNPAAPPDLATLFAAETLLENILRGHLTQTEIPLLLQALQQNGIAVHPTLTAAVGQVVPAAPLERLIELNRILKDSFITSLNDVVARLTQGSRNLQAPFAFAPNPAPVPAQPMFAAHTTAQLVQEATNIVQQYHAYIGLQIAAVPQHAQIAPLAAFAAAPALLVQLEVKPAEILNSFRDRLNAAISSQPERSPVRDARFYPTPADSFAVLQVKWNRVRAALNAHLRGLVEAETRRAIPAQNSKKDLLMRTLLQNLNTPAPAAGHPLQNLLIELQPVNHLRLERLLRIAEQFRIFEAEQRYWVLKHPIVTTVALTSLAALSWYFYSYRLSLDGVYPAANFAKNALRTLSSFGAALAHQPGSSS